MEDFKKVEDYDCHVALIKNGEAYGIACDNGEVILKCQFSKESVEFRLQLYREIYNRIEYIKKNDPNYSNEFNGEISIINNNNNYGIIDNCSNLLIKCIYNEGRAWDYYNSFTNIYSRVVSSEKELSKKL